MTDTLPINSDFGIKILLATSHDLPYLVTYLSREDIDGSFIKPLSQRTTTIHDRVHQDFKHGYWLIVKNKGNHIVGSLAVIIHDDTAECSTFSVAPEIRGHGIGEKIFFDAGIIIKELFPDIKHIRVDSRNTNEAMGYLMKDLGFQKIRTFADPDKRPEGIETVVYEKDI